MHPNLSMPNETVRDEEYIMPGTEFKNMMAGLRKSLADMANLMEDRTHRVDEYRVQNLGADSNSQVSLQPEYEVSEIIESIIVVGPAATPAFTLQLGKRAWNLVLPVSQVLVIAPVRISLGRNDPRILTSAIPGDWSVELMGFANFTESYRSVR
jgi:hypothetical protein